MKRSLMTYERRCQQRADYGAEPRRKAKMRRSKALLLSLALSMSCLVAPTALQAQAFNETQNSFFPIDLFIFIPCAADGQGEVVELTGELHDLFHITGDAAGGFYVKDQDNPQGVTGTGQTTGDKYQGTGVTVNEFTTKPGFQDTSINNFRIIGQGPGDDLLVHDTFHITMNAEGEVISFHDDFSAECK
jgi:hypothetical protein